MQNRCSVYTQGEGRNTLKANRFRTWERQQERKGPREYQGSKQEKQQIFPLLNPEGTKSGTRHRTCAPC